MFLKYGNKCADPNCQWLNADGTTGCTDSRCFQIDHVLNNGYVERREEMSQHMFLKRVLDDLTGKYQLLCANCHSIKHKRHAGAALNPPESDVSTSPSTNAPASSRYNKYSEAYDPRDNNAK